MAIFQEATDIPSSDEHRDDFVLSIVTRHAYEQFPWQESIFEEVSRSHAWMVAGLEEVTTSVVTEASIADMLGGMSLRDAIGATFMLQVGADRNNGIYDPSWLDQPNFADVLRLYPRAHIEWVANALTTTPAAYRLAYKSTAVGVPHLDRFDYNPLVATPFVKIADGPAIAPAARLILRTITPGGLYYKGISALGPSFARDLGNLFEHYIGRQLRLLDNAEVHPEVSYGRRRGSKSVDWFVVMPRLVLLVEVKSKRLGPTARAGSTSLSTALDDSLQKARNQLARTVELMAENRPEFAHIPTDRPLLGVIVTAEPFYTGAGYLMARNGAAISVSGFADVPVTTASAREIESLVVHNDELEDLLLRAIHRSDGGVVRLSDIPKNPGTDNPILAQAWESYPWPQNAVRPTTQR